MLDPCKSFSAEGGLSLEEGEKVSRERLRTAAERKRGRAKQQMWELNLEERNLERRLLRALLCVLCNRIAPWLLPIKESTESLGTEELTWWSACLIGTKPWVLALGLCKPGMMVCNLSILVSAGRGTEVQGYPWLQRELKDRCNDEA